MSSKRHVDTKVMLVIQKVKKCNHVSAGDCTHSIPLDAKAEFDILIVYTHDCNSILGTNEPNVEPVKTSTSN